MEHFALEGLGSKATGEGGREGHIHAMRMFGQFCCKGCT